MLVDLGNFWYHVLVAHYGEEGGRVEEGEEWVELVEGQVKICDDVGFEGGVDLTKM